MSWWGPSWRSGTHDTQGVNTDEVLGTLIHELEQSGSTLKVAIHMEPYPGKHAASAASQLNFMIRSFVWPRRSSCTKGAHMVGLYVIM